MAHCLNRVPYHGHKLQFLRQHTFYQQEIVVIYVIYQTKTKGCGRFHATIHVLLHFTIHSLKLDHFSGYLNASGDSKIQSGHE